MPYKSPKAIIEAVCASGGAKATLPIPKQLVLSFLAGAYVAFGGMLAIVVGRGSPELAKANPGLSAFAFGAVFPIGFVLVMIAGAELFTMNCSVVLPACLARAAKWRALSLNWVVVYLGNLIGALFVALFIAYWTGIIHSGDLGKAAADIAEAKIGMGWGSLLLRGIGGNWLACLAVWLATASDDAAGKILGTWLPIMAFAALGLEHAIADMFLVPLGMLNGAQVSVGQFLWNNLLPVTLGNIIGGAGFVGAIYWWIYGRD